MQKWREFHFKPLANKLPFDYLAYILLSQNLPTYCFFFVVQKNSNLQNLFALTPSSNLTSIRIKIEFAKLVWFWLEKSGTLFRRLLSDFLTSRGNEFFLDPSPFPGLSDVETDQNQIDPNHLSTSCHFKYKRPRIDAVKLPKPLLTSTFKMDLHCSLIQICEGASSLDSLFRCLQLFNKIWIIPTYPLIVPNT